MVWEEYRCGRATPHVTVPVKGDVMGFTILGWELDSLDGLRAQDIDIALSQ